MAPSPALLITYITAVLLSFYLPGQPEIFVPATRRPLNQLELWANCDQLFPSDDALLVGKRSRLPAPSATLFRTSNLGQIEVLDGERKLGRYHLFLAGRGP